jgi:DNA-directed RNA polymerase alpha subunit
VNEIELSVRRELPEQRQHHHRRTTRAKTGGEMLKYRNFGKKSLNGSGQTATA